MLPGGGPKVWKKCVLQRLLSGFGLLSRAITKGWNNMSLKSQAEYDSPYLTLVSKDMTYDHTNILISSCCF